MNKYKMYVYTVSMKKNYQIVAEDEKMSNDLLEAILSKEVSLIVDSVKVEDLEKLGEVEIKRPKPN